MRKILLIAAIVTPLFSCNKNKVPTIDKDAQNKTTAKDTTGLDKHIRDSTENAWDSDTTGLVNLSKLVVNLIKNFKIDLLSNLVHPVDGVRFSPYAFINIKTDRVILKKNLLDEWNSDKKNIWGSFDGSGEPIRMTTKEYFKDFVYPVDFENSSTLKINEFQGNSNSGNNLKEVYPGLDFVDYRFPGSDPAMEGMDWETLRLVYKTYKGERYLVAIIHDHWTI